MFFAVSSLVLLAVALSQLSLAMPQLRVNGIGHMFKERALPSNIPSNIPASFAKLVPTGTGGPFPRPSGAPTGCPTGPVPSGVPASVQSFFASLCGNKTAAATSVDTAIQSTNTSIISSLSLNSLQERALPTNFPTSGHSSVPTSVSSLFEELRTASGRPTNLPSGFPTSRPSGVPTNFPTGFPISKGAPILP